MKFKRARIAAVTAALTAAVVASEIHEALAQPPSGIVEVQIVTGKVTEPMLNDHHDGEGWKLDSGDSIHVPPPAFAVLQESVKSGDTVHATTTTKTLRDGRKVNEVVTMQIGDRHLAILPPAPPKPPKPRKHPKPKKEKPMKAKGTIASFHENHHGDVDGFTLDDGTEVKFPPRVGELLQEGLDVGTRVTVNGHWHKTPEGDIHLHADSINTAKYAYAIDHPKKPKPPKRGTGHEDGMTRKQADDVLKELRGIRRLLEQRGE